MSTDKVWADKLAQLFHDPFWKAWCQGQTAKDLALWLGGQLDGDVEQATWERGAQDKVGMLLSQRMLGDQFIFPGKGYLFKDARIIAEQVDAAGTAAAVAPDLAAAGADRPVLGAAHQVRVQLWEPQRSDIIVTHPLCAHPLRVPVPSNLPGLEAKLAPSLTVLDRYRDTIGRLPEAERAQSAVLLAWRLAEDLAAEDGIFWPLQPADTRCPDHSIWDHLRVASALAFIPDSQAADENLAAKNPERRPWLLSVWVGPTRDFLGTARTGRDLWTGSTMLAELAWAMMEPIAEALGPDAMVYPDLRGNLRADRWLHERHPEVLTARPVGSRAALIPNRFTAVVPEAQVEDLAAVARRSVEARWRAMAQRVREHLRAPDRLGPGAWEQVFEAQVETPPITRWVAVPWSWDGRNKDARALKPVDIQLPPIIPFQANPPQVPKAVEEIEAKRRSRFEDWIDPETFHHYQAARWTYLQTHPQYLLLQRGFDYPLHHHKLLTALDARKRLGDEVKGRPEPGEKCSLCGHRQALTNHTGGGMLGQLREEARALWAKVDPEGVGAERLCGPCAVRRYLTDSEDSITGNWKGTVAPSEGRGQHTVPFPSTGLVAGQLWLEKLCEDYPTQPDLQEAVKEVVRAFRDTGMTGTQFAGALPRLRRRLHRGIDGDLERFLRIDVQYLDPKKWEGTTDNAKEVRDATIGLREIVGQADTHLAVIALDGDGMGQLLLGSKDRVRATWKEVLHPDVVANLLDDSKADEPWRRAWRSTLESARLMGPSLHAFVSRSLRHFSNRVVPWVVERQFGGRLIYAGGDDALILCPAEDALPMLRRLHKCFTAAWIVDRHPTDTTWVNSEPNEERYEVGSVEARARFECPPGSELPRGGGGRIVPMLGPNSSFSAGVAFGHFKTSLRLLRGEAERQRDDVKRLRGGRGVGLSWFTRGGPKVRGMASLDGVEALQEVVEAFSGGRLPGRLPYKLRELLPLALALQEGSSGDALREEMTGLVSYALDGGAEYAERIAGIWLEGLEEANHASPEEAEASLGLLLFARALAGKVPRKARKKESEDAQ